MEFPIGEEVVIAPQETGPRADNTSGMRFAVVAHRRTKTNVALSRAGLDVRVLPPAVALKELSAGDVALGRLDVSERLDGIEIGLWELARLEGAGVRVLNRPRTLVAAHDKLATSRALAEAGVPHPRTTHVVSSSDRLPFEAPVVVKPRFGSWGKGVSLCEDAPAFQRHLLEIADRPWFRSHGALVQELVPPVGHDVRLVVAGGSIVGCIRRVAPPGEWRTNVALGAVREPEVPTQELCELAVRAAASIDADLVGVDILPTPDGGHVVIELNGAVEFTEDYALDGRSVFDRTLEALLPDPVAAVA
ncbi:MAG TPA: RimK family alpha-L-glutamate ligase [Gaiellaceae bacterium]|nr:RimK family alpha-L-glutamate ligase [Gaiellaceae bacterium]